VSDSAPEPTVLEKRLSEQLHDLRTPLNQIIGLSEMLIEIAEEKGDTDLSVGLGTVREGGLDLAAMLQDRSIIATEPQPGGEYWALPDASRASIGRVLGFCELALAEPPSPRLDEYRRDLEMICTAARHFIAGARSSGLFIRLHTAKHWDHTVPVGRAGAGASLSGGQMLIVDDESLNREMLIRRLQREGCKSTGARTGSEALELLRREKFDVILLDIQMPGMSGIEVLQALKEDPQLRHLPVIMLSALTDVDRVARCIELGAEDYLPKPINAVLLRARLGACLEKKRFRDHEQAQAEELLRASKLQSIGALAGGLAHDFNNMLTAVLGNLSLLRYRGRCPADLLPQVLEAERGALRAQELTRYLLTFAEGGAPIKESVPLAPLLRDTSAFVLRGSNVHCDIQLPSDLWALNADPNQLAQVISNVVLNAMEATPGAGQILLRAQNTNTAPHLPEGDYVAITVQDFGVGIAPDGLPRIFDPFFTTKNQARGLGLAAAYSIVQRHGGHIGVESRLGAGTTVVISLPASRVVHQSAPAPGAPNVRLADTGGQSLRVLVMDDEEPIRHLTKLALSMMKHEVVCTENGDAFLAAHAAARNSGRPFDIAILDLTIPGGMGGKEAIRALRERDPGIRAIVSSGYSTDPVMSQCAEHGFDAVLPKPYLVNDLLRLVQQLSAPRAKLPVDQIAAA
jgi:signal transduction histidine kinase